MRSLLEHVFRLDRCCCCLLRPFPLHHPRIRLLARVGIRFDRASILEIDLAMSDVATPLPSSPVRASPTCSCTPTRTSCTLPPGGVAVGEPSAGEGASGGGGEDGKGCNCSWVGVDAISAPSRGRASADGRASSSPTITSGDARRVDVEKPSLHVQGPLSTTNRPRCSRCDGRNGYGTRAWLSRRIFGGRSSVRPSHDPSKKRRKIHTYSHFSIVPCSREETPISRPFLPFCSDGIPPVLPIHRRSLKGRLEGIERDGLGRRRRFGRTKAAADCNARVRAAMGRFRDGREKVRDERRTLDERRGSKEKKRNAVPQMERKRASCGG